MTSLRDELLWKGRSFVAISRILIVGDCHVASLLAMTGSFKFLVDEASTIIIFYFDKVVGDFGWIVWH